jgi:hypothetical protein
VLLDRKLMYIKNFRMFETEGKMNLYHIGIGI